jgi:hypothetical protein
MATIAIAALLLLVSAAPAAAQDPGWQFGGFADLAYLFDTNRPANHETRSRGTAWRVNEPALNIAGVSVATDQRRPWRVELIVHAGRDAEKFAASPTAPNLKGSDWLRHVGRASGSYDVRPALRIQGGIFNSLIGYDSLYAKDNLHYTRPWTADFTPYLMMGANAVWHVTDRVSVTPFIVNGYWHLAAANHVPSSGLQISLAKSAHVTIKQTVMIGPHQADTSAGLWRVLSDTIAERKWPHGLVAINAQIANERVDESGRPRAWWAAAQVPMAWSIASRWRLALRPEAAWDSRARFTGFEQTVVALTGTVDFRIENRGGVAILRTETSHTTSRGPGGGFFTPEPGVLTPSQHLFLVSLLVSFGN